MEPVPPATLTETEESSNQAAPLTEITSPDASEPVEQVSADELAPDVSSPDQLLYHSEYWDHLAAAPFRFFALTPDMFEDSPTFRRWLRDTQTHNVLDLFHDIETCPVTRFVFFKTAEVPLHWSIDQVSQEVERINKRNGRCSVSLPAKLGRRWYKIVKKELRKAAQSSGWHQNSEYSLKMAINAAKTPYFQ